MKTAVEWLEDELHAFIHPEHEKDFLPIFKQALEMEKQQIIEARLKPLLLFKELREKHGYFGGHDNGQVIDREINESELYYNETFKTK